MAPTRQLISRADRLNPGQLQSVRDGLNRCAAARRCCPLSGESRSRRGSCKVRQASAVEAEVDHDHDHSHDHDHHDHTHVDVGGTVRLEQFITRAALEQLLPERCGSWLAPESAWLAGKTLPLQPQMVGPRLESRFKRHRITPGNPVMPGRSRGIGFNPVIAALLSARLLA